MIETLWDEAPTAKERVAQNQGGVVPDEPIAESGRVATKHRSEDNQNRNNFFHDESERINKVRVAI